MDLSWNEDNAATPNGLVKVRVAAELVAPEGQGQVADCDAANFINPFGCA
jgi:hypothetical protein